ncbi:MAG: S9 family peptidase [Thermoplasmatota archaeon]
MSPETAPCGSWMSPITAQMVSARAAGLGEILVDGQDVYWLEERPSEDRRNVLMRRTPDGRVESILPPPYSARTGFRDYGGGSVAVDGGKVYFVNFQDQCVYAFRPGESPVPITPEGPLRYADLQVDRSSNALICVVEEHLEEGTRNAIARVDLESGETTRLVEGRDFYSSPSIDPEGKRLAWLSWDRPSLPWIGTELWTGTLGEGIEEAHQVAGGREESIFQPEWSVEGKLHFISDRNGWWNLYRLDGGISPEGISPLTEMAADLGTAQWLFNFSTYGFLRDGRVAAACCDRGIWSLVTIDRTGEVSILDDEFTVISYLVTGEDFVVFRGGSPTRYRSVVMHDLEEGSRVLRSSSNQGLDDSYISLPRRVEFPSGEDNAHGFYYAPCNPDFAAPDGEDPPLVVMTHGGSTAAVTTALNLEILYWTSRGMGVLTVNYGGSTGYGRDYRMRLRGSWGLVDVLDCLNGARAMVDRGMADRDRLIIRGRSVSGYTALSALTFGDLFDAGGIHHGVSDLESLARGSLPSASIYLEELVGPYPERADLYRERSPLHRAEELSAPTVFFQGLDDRIVHPSQTEVMVRSLRDKGVPVSYVTFNREGHRFAREDSLREALEGELYFYSRVLGFPLADLPEPIEIENLGSIAGRSSLSRDPTS